MNGTIERITARSDDDWLCVCGNEVHLDGFYPYHDGREVEATTGGPWDGIHFFCASCFRVINQETLEVVEQRDNVELLDGPVSVSPHECEWTYVTTDGPLGHGWECSICGDYQAG